MGDPPRVIVGERISLKTWVSFIVKMGANSTYIPTAWLRGIREILHVRRSKEIYSVIASIQQRLHGGSRMSGVWRNRGHSESMQSGRAHPKLEMGWRGACWAGTVQRLNTRNTLLSWASAHNAGSSHLFWLPSPSQDKNLESRSGGSAWMPWLSTFSWAAGRASFWGFAN